MPPNLLERFTRPVKIYILPSYQGIIFSFTMLSMLFIGLAYTNNLILFTTFILFSIYFVSMIYTNYNLAGIEIVDMKFQDGFAHLGQGLVLVIKNSSKNHRTALWAILESYDNSKEIHSKGLRPGKSTDQIPIFIESLAPGEKKKIEHSFNWTIRGEYNFLKVTLHTTFPFGFFYSWKYFVINSILYVYPRPLGAKLEMSQIKSILDEKGEKKYQHTGEFQEHRPYQASDSFKKVDWKAYARGLPLMTKVFEEDEQKIWYLNFNQMGPIDLEDKLSQLSLWIQEAFYRKESWELSLPTKTFPVGKNVEHYKNCLEALSSYEQ